MQIFRYTARTAAGETVRGALRAETLAQAAIDLRRRTLFATSIARNRALRRPQVAAAKRESLHGFFRAFATLLRCGVTMRRALDVAIANSRDRALRESLRGIVSDIEHGSSLSAALTRRPHEFDALHVAMIEAGEAGGVLDAILGRLADVLDREHALRKKVQTALAYPLIVASAASVLIIFLLFYIVPTFASMFARFGVALPLSVRLLMQASEIVRAPLSWAAALAAIAIVALLAVASRRSAPAAIAFERLRLRLPVVGVVLRYAIVGRITRMLGLLLQSGVGMLRAIEVVAPVAASAPFAQALAEIADALRRGESFREPAMRASLFDPLTLSLIRIGEETGTLDEMLLAAAAYSDVELESALATLTAVIEPIVIGFLGAVVCGIVFSIFLPLYTLIGSIS